MLTLLALLALLAWLELGNPDVTRQLNKGSLYAQVREDALNHLRLHDRSDDLQLSAAVRAVFQIDLEHALEQPQW